MAKGFAIQVKRGARGRDPLSLRELSADTRTSARAAEKLLLAAAQRGEPRALRRLLEAAAGPAWRFSRGFCRDPDDAEDLVQDVLVTLLRTLPRFRGDSSLSTWIYTVARRACARRRRRRQRFESSDRSAAAALERRMDPAATPPQQLERSELAAALESAIASLPDAQKQVLVMRDVEGLSAAEVATVLGIGDRAVKSRLHRARVALRARLLPYIGGEALPAVSATCPDIARILSQYLEGEISASTCERMEEHVQGCAACGGVCESLRKVLGACRAYGATPVPSEVRQAVRRAIGQMTQG